MNDHELLTVLDGIAGPILCRDWKTLDRWQSAWLADRDAGRLRREIERLIEGTVREQRLDPSAWPDDAMCEPGAAEFSTLREQLGNDLDPGITAENVVSWCCIQLLADEEAPMESFGNVWLLLIDTPAGTKIGHFQVTPAE